MPAHRFWDGIRYLWPAECVTPVPGMGQALRAWRKEAVHDQEWWLQQQKAAGRSDPQFARFCKEESRRYLRLQRACTLMLPWVAEPDNNQAEQRPKLWPLEMCSELDEIARRLVMQFG